MENHLLLSKINMHILQSFFFFLLKINLKVGRGSQKLYGVPATRQSM